MIKNKVSYIIYDIIEAHGPSTFESYRLEYILFLSYVRNKQYN